MGVAHKSGSTCGMGRANKSNTISTKIEEYWRPNEFMASLTLLRNNGFGKSWWTAKIMTLSDTNSPRVHPGAFTRTSHWGTSTTAPIVM
ncbi:hypothetical protein ACRALDRAFT_209542 [Sodiomyces alcalophilus JCM 7366]|uniref:uncharacterized protein n=1 Tax=Sodiomyces alcalophilus JCM 7366 TaxID=591952 RepID=UPI0039B62D32